MIKRLGFVQFAAAACLVGLSAPAMAGGAFFDDFDYMADQAALEASDWDPADGKANGQLDTAHAFGHKAVRSEQTPTETRARHRLGGSPPASGRLDLWFYDDGADIKAFDITVSDGSSSAAVGLHDAQSGSDTNYICTLNSAAGDTGIARSEGWHLVQFAVNPTTGTVIQIDKEDFPGNVLATMTAADHLTVYTNLGNASDANQVWIDTVSWKQNAADAVLPADAFVKFIEHFDVLSSSWAPMPGTTEADLHHITDAGSAGSTSCIDVYDGGGARGFQGQLVGVVPFNGKYRLAFDYENGGAYGGGLGPWENLTVTMNGASSVNLGSAQVNLWQRAETTGAIELTISDDITIQVTADASAAAGFCRFDNFSLILTEFTPPITSASDWQLY